VEHGRSRQRQKRRARKMWKHVDGRVRRMDRLNLAVMTIHSRTPTAPTRIQPVS
jgi:hypothetical protein